MASSSFYSSSSSSSFFDIEPLDGGETCRHAMDACSLCGKPLAGNCDIFMYRGDRPFCSEECRYHQMETDQVSVRMNTEPAKGRAATNGQRHRHETSAVRLRVRQRHPRGKCAHCELRSRQSRGRKHQVPFRK